MYHGATEHPCSQTTAQQDRQARETIMSATMMAECGSATGSGNSATQLVFVPGMSVVCMGRWPSKRSTSLGDC